MKKMKFTESEFLYHAPCSNCGSSDANSVYSDGHSYCFSCQTYTHGDSSKEHRYNMTIPSSLIPEGTYQALTKRKLQADTLRKFGYTIGQYKGQPVHIAPYYDRTTGHLTAQHLRFPNKEFSWLGESKNVQLFGQHLWSGNSKMIVVTEGEIDCLSVSQAQDNRYPVVSIPSGAQGAKRAVINNLDFLESFERVVFAFDNDPQGKAAAHECALVLSPGKARICTFPLKDASDMLQAGRIKEIISCIWEAKPWRPDGLISGKDLWDDLIAPPVAGWATPYPMIDSMTGGGLRKGELTLFTAGSGIGKSTLVNMIGYHFLTVHGLSIGVMALEESRKRTAERYVGIALKKPIHITREGITEEAMKQAYDNTINSDKFWLYDHFGSTAIDNLMGKLRYMIVALGVDFVILDHISIVVSGLDEVAESERKLIDKLMTRLRSLIEETKAGVLAIVHLKRPEGGKSYNEGRQVALTDLRGSGSLEQLSDVVIAMERDQQSEDGCNTAILRVLKNRPIGITGECGSVEYDPHTGLLTPISIFDIKPVAKDIKEGELDF